MKGSLAVTVMTLFDDYSRTDGKWQAFSIGTLSIKDWIQARADLSQYTDTPSALAAEIMQWPNASKNL